jgi:hypothetical protein
MKNKSKVKSKDRNKERGEKPIQVEIVNNNKAVH